MGTANDAVEGLLVLIDERRPQLTDPVGSPRQFAAGGLARGAALVRGAILVVDDGHEDLVGVFVRAVWECWCVGLWTLKRGAEGVALLEEKDRQWMARYLRELPSAIPSQPIDPEYEAYLARDSGALPPSIWSMAKEVEKWLQTVRAGPIAYADISSYRVLYRIESHFSAHANFASFGRYLDPPNAPLAEKSKVVQRVIEPHPSESLQTKAVPAAAAYLAHLAWFVYNAFDLSTEEVETILDGLLREADMFRPDSPIT
jgi:hypothetical protein